MKDASVAIVIPCLEDAGLLAGCLPPLVEERVARGRRDRILVVDDSGGGGLAAWVAAQHPEVEVLSLPENVGFAAAALAGARHSSEEGFFLLNPDVVVRAGILDALLAALADPQVFAASPRVLLNGDPDWIESSNALIWNNGRLAPQSGSGHSREAGSAPLPTAFGIGGALLLRREEFLERGFDPLFGPFYWEDVDLCLEAWRAGRSVVEVPAAVVEHHHRGSIGPRVPKAWVNAAIEKNKWLLTWKYLDGGERAQRHMVELTRSLIDAVAADRREPLIELCLALEQLEQLERSRKSLGPAGRSMEQVLRDSRPGR